MSLSRIQDSFDRQSFMAHIGARLVKLAPGIVEIDVERRQSLLQQNGFLHAGVITSILDSACGYAAATTMDPTSDVLSVEFKVNLLAPAVGDRFLARATVLRSGRTLTVCRGDAFAMDGESPILVAAMQATLITMPSGRREDGRSEDETTRRREDE